MNDLAREIEDDIRRERFDRLWKRFGRIMVGISVLVVLVTIAVVVMQNQKENHAMEKTAQYIRGIDRMNVEDYKGAITVFSEFSDEEDSSYYGLAMLQKAKAQEALGNQEAAGRTYQMLAKKQGVFGSLAALLAPMETGKMITPNKESPFYYTQQEWKAWQLLQANQKEEAIAIFMSLRENLDAPMSLRSRMNDVVQHIAPEKLLPENPVTKTDGKNTAKKAKPTSDKGTSDE